MTGFKRSLKYSLVLLPRMWPSWLTKISFWPLMDLAKAEFSAKTLNCLPGYFVGLALGSNLNLTYRRHSRKITFWTFSPSGLPTFTPQMQRKFVFVLQPGLAGWFQWSTNIFALKRAKNYDMILMSLINFAMLQRRSPLMFLGPLRFWICFFHTLKISASFKRGFCCFRHNVFLDLLLFVLMGFTATAPPRAMDR